jgi:hypothetical protein
MKIKNIRWQLGGMLQRDSLSHFARRYRISGCIMGI